MKFERLVLIGIDLIIKMIRAQHTGGEHPFDYTAGFYKWGNAVDEYLKQEKD